MAERERQTRWRWMGAGLLVVAVLWWLWPRGEGSSPESEGRRGRVVNNPFPVRDAERRAQTLRSDVARLLAAETAARQSQSPPQALPVPNSPPPSPEPAQAPTARVSVEVRVINDEGQPVQALVTSDDCGLRRTANEGRLHLDLDSALGKCTFRAGRKDGLLYAWSSPETVSLEGIENAGVLTLQVPTEKMAGLGIHIRSQNGAILVEGLVPEGPAMAAGLQPGDLVVGVDGVPSNQLSVDEFIDLATGPVNSDVTLLVASPEGGEPRQVKLTRRPIDAPD